MTKKDIIEFKKLNTIGVMVESICRKLNTNPVNNDAEQGPVNFVHRDEDLKLFPATTVAALYIIETKMKDPAFYKKVVCIEWVKPLYFSL